MSIKPMVHMNVRFIIAITFFALNFSFHPNPCHGCHDLLQKATSLIKLQSFSIKGNAYRIHILGLSKNEAINMMKKRFNINSN